MQIFAQTDTSLNRIDAKGKRQGYWIITASMKKLGSPWIQHQTVEEGTYIDSRKEGRWIEYFPNGLVKSERDYVKGRESGLVRIYYENPHVLREEYSKWNNKYVGSYRSYYSSGQIAGNYNYDSTGFRNGMQTTWYDGGTLKSESMYVHGKLHGWTREYYSNGKISREQFYDQGRIVPTETKVYPENDPTKKVKPTPEYVPLNDSICKDCEYQNGKLINGQLISRDNNGKIVLIRIYKDGKYIGDAPLPEEKK